jgi:hypothetical protein
LGRLTPARAAVWFWLTLGRIEAVIITLYNQWNRAFAYFIVKPALLTNKPLKRYGLKRNEIRGSSVIGIILSVKRKFGDSIRSRSKVASRNEVYCKLLAHNICVVHASHVLLGIEPIFYPKSNENAVILPMSRA